MSDNDSDTLLDNDTASSRLSSTRLWYHTWTILPVERTIHDNDNDDKTATTTNDLRALEQEITRSISSSSSDFAKVSWIDEDGIADTGSARSIRSTIETDTDSNEDDSNDTQQQRLKRRHLYVELWLQEEWSASVVCLKGYCLARGRQSSYQRILNCGSTLLGVDVADPLRLLGSSFTSTELLAQAVSAWTMAVVSPYSNHNNHHQSKNVAEATFQKTKSLTLTFRAPKNIATQGLSDVTLSIPPVSLKLLLQRLQQEAKKRKKTTVDPTPKHTENVSETTLPIVKAIHHYIRDAFGLDVTSFALIKVVTPLASLGYVDDNRSSKRGGGGFSVHYRPTTCVGASLPEITSLVHRCRRRHSHHSHRPRQSRHFSKQPPQQSSSASSSGPASVNT